MRLVVDQVGRFPDHISFVDHDKGFPVTMITFAPRLGLLDAGLYRAQQCAHVRNGKASFTPSYTVNDAAGREVRSFDMSPSTPST